MTISVVGGFEEIVLLAEFRSEDDLSGKFLLVRVIILPNGTVPFFLQINLLLNNLQKSMAQNESCRNRIFLGSCGNF